MKNVLIDHDSLIDFWEKGAHKKVSFCRHCGERTTGLCDRQLQIVKKNADNKWHRTSKKFVALLCSKCNYSENNSIFNGDENDIVTVDFLN